MHAVDDVQTRRLITVNPFRCRVWKGHDRLDDHINEDNCREEIKSFMEHGQRVPVLGRKLENDASHEIELIYGARRLFVAQHLNTPLLVELCEMSDRQAVVAMDLENRHRKDISPYERGLSYSRWLRSGYFESQDAIARSLQISSSQVSRLLRLARLPSVIVGAFSSALEICEGWGAALAEAADDPERRRHAIQAAREIGAMLPRPPAREVYRQLLASTVPGRKVKASAHDRVVKSASGLPLFRVRCRRESIALIIPIEKVSRDALAEVEHAVARILQRAVEIRPTCRQVDNSCAPL